MWHCKVAYQVNYIKMIVALQSQGAILVSFTVLIIIETKCIIAKL